MQSLSKKNSSILNEEEDMQFYVYSEQNLVTTIGVRSNRRTPGANNIKSPIGKSDRLTVCVEKMAKSVHALAASFSNNDASDMKGFVQDKVKNKMRAMEDKLRTLISLVS